MMKRILSCVAIAAIVATAALSTAAAPTPRVAFQRTDLAGYVDGKVTISPNFRTNSAVTGAWVDVANYSGAMLVIATGQVDAAHYVVLQDSSSGMAVATIDSVQIAAANDTTYLELAYRGTKRYVRALQRATPAGGDSTYSGIVVLRGGGRNR